MRWLRCTEGVWHERGLKNIGKYSAIRSKEVKRSVHHNKSEFIIASSQGSNHCGKYLKFRYRALHQINLLVGARLSTIL